MGTRLQRQTGQEVELADWKLNCQGMRALAILRLLPKRVLWSNVWTRSTLFTLSEKYPALYLSRQDKEGSRSIMRFVNQVVSENMPNLSYPTPFLLSSSTTQRDRVDADMKINGTFNRFLPSTTATAAFTMYVTSSIDGRFKTFNRNPVVSYTIQNKKGSNSSLITGQDQDQFLIELPKEKEVVKRKR